MAQVYYESDCNVGELQGKRIAVIGFGSQGHAHALNLHDSGLDVVVGLYEGSRSAARAREAGLAVATNSDAAAQSDIIMILNEKYNIVAKVNIEFNPYQAQRFRDWVIVSVEKNRGGQDQVDLEFEKHFEFSCFDPNGRTVQEKLIEERLYND